MRLEKQGNKWTFRYYENGIQKRKTIEALTSSQAKQLQYEFLNRNKIGSNKVFNITLTAYINEYLVYSQTNKRLNTYKKDIFTTNNLLHLMPVKLLKDITSKHLENYKIERLKQIKSVSINRELEAIKAFFNKAVEWKYINENPAKYVKIIKQAKKAPRYLNKTEIKILLETAKGFYKDMVFIALYTGFRISEVYNLQWQDIKFEAETISVNPKQNFIPKDYEFRTIPLHTILKTYLLKMRPKTFIETDHIIKSQQPLNTIQVGFNKIFKLSNIQNASFHTLRHTFASYLVINNISLYTVSKLLGHSKLETTMIYAHLSKEHLKASIECLKF